MATRRFSTTALPLWAACALTLLSSATSARAQSFSLIATPAKLYVNEHGAAASTITIEPADRFTGSVTLSVSGLPKGTVAEFKPGSSTTSTSTLVIASGAVAVTGATTVTITGVSGSLTQTLSMPLAVSAATNTAGIGTMVDLSPAYNVYGIYTNGTSFSTGGLDGVGWAYSTNLLTPARNFNGIQFTFGPANEPDAVSGTGQPIMLPAGQFSSMAMLATGVEGNQTGQIVKVNYADGTASELALNFSDWFTPQSYPDEYEAVTMPYRCMADGGLDSRGNFYLYAHFFPLDSSKTVQSLTLNANRDVVILAVTLIAP